MRTNPYQTYLDAEILTAEPLKLVRLLYRGALEAVRTARAKLAGRDIRGRSSAVSKSIEILAELSSSLNHQRGGELSARLAALYDYMQRRLIEANREQSDSPLAEVEKLLITLEEAWCQTGGSPAETAHAIPDGTVPVDSSEVGVLNPIESADYVPLRSAY